MEKEVKCIVWDLDHTMWEGILVEDQAVTLKPQIISILKELDERGILHSIASKNNHDDAIGKLQQFGIAEFFLYPEIHWNSKSSSIKRIAQNLNIGLDSILFIDDQEFERDEVQSEIPEVACMSAEEYLNLLSTPRCNPRFITEDSRRRRMMYIEDRKRKEEELAYVGPTEKFLQTLGMRLIISEAEEHDLKRAEELTVRTNQLNATGITYSYEELDSYRKSEDHKLYICELIDKYGSNGKIGLALVETKQEWHLKLLLMSCRVMSRGIGTILLNYIMKQAKEHGEKLLADFRKTERNKQMYITYKFANFKELQTEDNGYVLFMNDLSRIQEFPSYVDVIVPQDVNISK